MKHTCIAASLFALSCTMGTVIAAPERATGNPEAPSGAEPAAETRSSAEEAGTKVESESTPSAPVPAAFESDAEKVNYSLGYELGQDLKREELEPIPEAVLKGIEDAVSGAKPQVKASERRKALAEIKAKRDQANLERSQAFLAENAQKDGVKTLPSGLQYKELKPGEGEIPTITSEVTVNYRGTLIDGSEFASSYEQGRPSKFLVKKVIKGWREALQLMKEGAKWELYIPPDLAYGKQSPLNRIPPNSALIYEVELISVQEAPPPPPRRARPPFPQAPSDDE